MNSEKQAGSLEKGFLYLLFSNALFFITSYLIYFLLARLLSTQDFGVYGVVIAFVSMIDLILVTGIQQSVSKFVSENAVNAELVTRKALKLQFFVGLIAALAFFTLADLIAALLNDSSLSPFLRLSSAIIFTQLLFSVFIGYYNGLKSFKKQAALNSIYYILKLSLIVGLAFLSFGVFGAIAGFLLASLIALIVSVASTRLSKPQGSFSTKRLFSFALPLTAFALITNLLLNVGIFAVKSFTQSALSNDFAAFFIVASTISQIPFFITLSFSHFIFPLVSSTFSKGKNEKTSFYVSNAVRYAILIIAPLTVLIASTPKELISLLYSSAFLPGWQALQVLSIAFAFFSLYLILTSIISAAGKPKVSMLSGAIVIILNFALLFALVPTLELFGAAIASLISLTSGLAIAIAYCFLKFKFKIFNYSSIAKVLLASLLVFLAAIAFPASGLLLLLKYFALALFYLLLVFLLKELNKQDFKLALSMVSK